MTTGVQGRGYGLVKKGLWLAALVPAVFTGWLIARHAVDFPFADEWDTPGGVVEASGENRLTWAELGSQHNESRMLVPKVVFLSLLREGHWDVRRAMGASFAVVGLTALGLAWLARRELHLTGAPLAGAMLLVSLVLFNPSQAFNWLFGIQLSFFLPFLFLVGCLAVSVSGAHLIGRAAAVALLSTLSTFTHSAGVVCWLAGGLFLFGRALVRDGGEGRSRAGLVAAIALWVAALAGCALLYGSGYVKPSHHPDLGRALEDPLGAARFLLAFLAGPMVSRPAAAPAAIGGGALLLVTTYLVGRSWSGAPRRGDLLCWALVTSSVATGLLITVGRFGFGIDAALESRYSTFGVPLYVALALVLTRWLADAGGESSARRWARRSGAAVAAGVMVLCSLTAAEAGVEEMRWMERDRRVKRAALYFVDQADFSAVLRQALPHAHHLLRARRLAGNDVLRPGIATSAAWAKAEAPEAESDRFGQIDSLEAREEQGRAQVVVGGWAFLPDRQRLPDAVVVAAKGTGDWQAIALAAPGGHRAEIAAVKGGPYVTSGWSARIHCRPLPPGTLVGAWAFDGDAQAMHPLVGRFTLRDEHCGTEHRRIEVQTGRLNRPHSLREIGWLYAGSGVIVAERGRLDLHAERGVALGNGFRVETGGWLRLQSPYLKPSESLDSASTRTVSTRTPPPGS